MNITDNAKQLCKHALALNDEQMMMEVSEYEKKLKHMPFSPALSLPVVWPVHIPHDRHSSIRAKAMSIYKSI